MLLSPIAKEVIYSNSISIRLNTKSKLNIQSPFTLHLCGWWVFCTGMNLKLYSKHIGYVFVSLVFFWYFLQFGINVTAGFNTHSSHFANSTIFICFCSYTMFYTLLLFPPGTIKIICRTRKKFSLQTYG